MRIEKISITDQNTLFNELDKRLRSVKRTNISYNVMANGKDVASITLRISGRQGTISKNLVVIYDYVELCWVLYFDSTKVYLDETGFGGIINMIKKIISSTNNLISKL